VVAKREQVHERFGLQIASRVGVTLLTDDVTIDVTYKCTKNGSSSWQSAVMAAGSNSIYFQHLDDWVDNDLVRFKGEFFYHTSAAI
jgi:hypothetical protein